MLKIFKTLLASGLALFVFGFFAVTHAAKPPQEQIVTSAPLLGHSHTCTLINVSGHAYDATISIVAFNHDPGTYEYFVPIGGYAAHGYSYQNDLDWAFCEITWLGEKGDFKASFCSFENW